MQFGAVQQGDRPDPLRRVGAGSAHVVVEGEVSGLDHLIEPLTLAHLLGVLPAAPHSAAGPDPGDRIELIAQLRDAVVGPGTVEHDDVGTHPSEYLTHTGDEQFLPD